MVGTIVLVLILTFSCTLQLDLAYIFLALTLELNIQDDTEYTILLSLGNKMGKKAMNVGLPVMILLGKPAPAPTSFSEWSVMYYKYIGYYASVLH